MLPSSRRARCSGTRRDFRARRSFTDDELSLYDAIEQQLGVAIEKALLFEELRETTRLGDALNDINEVLLRSMDPT